MAKTLMFVALLWCAFCEASTEHNAVVWMKNGDRLTGVITQQDKDIVFLNLPYSGQVQLPRAQIDRIEQQKLLAAPIVVAETHAVVIKNQAVRHSSVDLTAGKKRSSSSTDNLGFKTAFEQRDTNIRLTFDGKYDYETSNSLKKTHKYLLNPGADYFFQPQLFWRNKVDYSQDFIAADYKNIDLSSGLGYSFYDTAELRIEFIALAGLKRTHFKETAGLELFLGDRQQLDFRHIQLEWDLRYLWPGSSFEVFSEGSYLKPVNQPVQYIEFRQDINISSGLHYYLTERIRLSFSVDLDWSKIDVVLPRYEGFSADSRDLHQKLSIGAKF
ncbi:DUF481 domain-containing protein [Rheinheimera tangshanensis]|uniref:DUF481 domain-containing protein n=1 Tax=Rheinheimera tangshanensis TaxID=400153 RepID=A0A5C8LPB3_9GAMM|nr:DUF481 domain-containing protein [Rheinheimera tangshanensis]TXK78064.1 DUF481 domain-containing protein [Rheinheimera tangshanensis]GGM70355.1 hypothetical protein GCM10010920_34020 [Rheinheimera tangshanensis]